jgi:hypothetical protein
MKKVTIRTTATPTATPTPTGFVPNRLADVEAICAAHPEAFPPGDANDPARLQLLTETMVPQINADHPEDGGNWGVLTKTDQNNKIPCDVMVWRPGTVTIDVMTGTGASWDVHGPANNPLWLWTACPGDDSGESEGGGQDLTSLAPPYAEEYAVQFGMACNDTIDEANVVPDGGMIAVHAQRCAYDFYVGGMAWDQCYTKHVNEFRAEYGLPPV